MSTNPTLVDPVATLLDDLTGSGWRVLHATRWPGHPGHGLAHVVVGPGGIVVVAEPHPPVHDDVVDPLAEDLACATAAVTALVAPRHRCLVQGVLVLAPGVEAPTLATCVPQDSLVDWLGARPQRLGMVETVLVAAYLRDQLATDGRARRQSQVPRPARPVDQADPDSGFPDPHERRRRRLSWGPDVSTAMLVVAGLLAPWAVAAVLHLF